MVEASISISQHRNIHSLNHGSLAGFRSHGLVAAEAKVRELSGELDEAKSVIHAQEEQLKSFKLVGEGPSKSADNIINSY